MRKRVGNRRHLATFSQHNGSTDTAGQPTYANAADWTTVLGEWPCELLQTSGGEVLRGRQVTAQTTHVFFGDFMGSEAEPTYRIIVSGRNYSIVSVLDPDGLGL